MSDNMPVVYVDGKLYTHADIKQGVATYRVKRWVWLPDWCLHFSWLTITGSYTYDYVEMQRPIAAGSLGVMRYTYEVDSDE